MKRSTLLRFINITESRQTMKLREVDNEKVYSTTFHKSTDRRQNMKFREEDNDKVYSTTFQIAPKVHKA